MKLEGRIQCKVAETHWMHNHFGSKYQCRAQERQELLQKGYLDRECWWHYSHKQTAHWYGNCWRVAHKVAVAEPVAAVIATVVGLCQNHLKEEGDTRHTSCRKSTVGEQQEAVVDPGKDNHRGIQS